MIMVIMGYIKMELLNTVKNNNYIKNILKAILVAIIVGGGLLFYWEIQLKGYSMPIWHTVSLENGSFKTTVGSVREIKIQTENPIENVDISLSISDNSGNTLFQREYKNQNIQKEFGLLDTFSKDEPLNLPAGKYKLKLLVNNETAPYINVAVLEYNGNFSRLFGILAILIVVSSIALLGLNKSMQRSVSITYFILFVMLGLVFNYIQPPLGVPDEKSHFMEAYKISSKFLFQPVTDSNNKVIFRVDDVDSMHYLNDISNIAGWYDSFHNGNIEDTITADYVSTVSSKGKYAYIPGALGICIARILRLNGHWLLILGRLSNLITVGFIISMAIKIIPYGKLYVFSIGLIPEVVYLAMSYSYDGINLALCALIVAYVLYMIQKEEIRLKELAVFFLLCIIMIPIKTVYVFWIVLILLIPKKNIHITKKQKIICGVLLAVFIFIACSILMPSVKRTMNSEVSYTGYERISYAYAKDNLRSIFERYYYTVTTWGNKLFSEAFGEIVGAGRYTGHDCYTLSSWLQFIILTAMLVGIEDSDRNKLSVWRRLLVAGIAIGCIIGVMTSMLFAFTTTIDWRIMGLQGRYFLPVFALVPLITKNRYYKLTFNRESYCLFSMGVINLIYILAAFSHYATNYFT